MNSLDARDTATTPSCATCFFECKHFTLFLIFPSVEARFRTSVLNRHSRVYVADPMLSAIRSTPCACGSLCAHREPHAQGVLYVCCKQMLKTLLKVNSFGPSPKEVSLLAVKALGFCYNGVNLTLSGVFNPWTPETWLSSRAD